MREDPDNHGRVFDGGDDLQLAAAVRANARCRCRGRISVNAPTHARRCLQGLVGGPTGFAGHDRCTQPRMGCQHPVEADEVQPRARHQGGQALHEFQRRHDDVGGAVSEGALQLQHDLALRDTSCKINDFYIDSNIWRNLLPLDHQRRL